MNCPPVIFTVYVCNEIKRVNPHESTRNMLKKKLTHFFSLWVAFVKIPNTLDIQLQRGKTWKVNSCELNTVFHLRSSELFTSSLFLRCESVTTSPGTMWGKAHWSLSKFLGFFCFLLCRQKFSDLEGERWPEKVSARCQCQVQGITG